MKEKGFTLLEMILAVALLAGASLFIVQYFISAHNLNAKAADLDQSVWLSQETLEAFKSMSDVSAFQNGGWQPEQLPPGLQVKYQVHQQGRLYTLQVQVMRTKPYWLETPGERLVYEVQLQRYIKEKAGVVYVQGDKK